MDLADRFGDLIHVTARAEQHRLREPHALVAQLVVGGAAHSLPIAVENALAIDPLKPARGQRALEEGLLV